MPPVPPAPWELRGQCMVAAVCRPRHEPEAPLPAGVGPVGNWWVVVAARYTESTVGPYLELAVGRLAMASRRVGLCITTMAVTSPASSDGGRHNWGFPKEVAALSWDHGGGWWSLRWEERGVEVRARSAGVPVPAAVPLPVVQRRVDGAVATTARARGRASPGRVEVTAPSGDALAGLRGRHFGARVADLRLLVEQARGVGGKRASE